MMWLLRRVLCAIFGHTDNTCYIYEDRRTVQHECWHCGRRTKETPYA